MASDVGEMLRYRVDVEIDFFERASLDDPLRRYELTVGLGGRAQLTLHHAITCYSGGRPDLAARFARQTERFCQKVVEDRRWETHPKIRDGAIVDYEQGKVLHALALAGFLLDRGLDTALLRTATPLVAVLQECLTSDVQNEILQSLLCALLADDAKQTKHLLRRRPKFRELEPLRDVLRDLARERRVDEALGGRIEALIDVYRDPRALRSVVFDRGMVTLELAILREAYRDGYRPDVRLTPVVALLSR